MVVVVLEPLAALGHGGDVAGWGPPEAVAGLVHLFEPLGTITDYLRVIRIVGETVQRLDGLPDGHVDDHERIVVESDVGGIARFQLEPPDKARRLVGKSISGSELAAESRNLRSVNASTDTRLISWSS